jgi:hypothetical protein
MQYYFHMWYKQNLETIVKTGAKIRCFLEYWVLG